ncbi:hypothetical protein Bresa_00925|uniref:Outer membrane beta-barrel porin/alpha-amylase n=1 Tax=Brenneria salicis ATCC 15712 = DSM 30166 TaxID=714314 RepID=A0A366I5E3_9GAMM|nr:transporter [Brenneria salicis]NMN90825.1 hypothetical protein [Brenneria salicis ATCC 15712 = DSM 30166]RBP63549.1 hypothetical protein DES54_11162 [Brenneria salicis ATCC 15712 = DSM 30166]RLM30970.1 phenol degradation protein meta [Brenneria salicis ATCC 15712 = DSM 30166]
MSKSRYLFLAALLPAFYTQAVEVTPGDYEQLPVGTTLGLLYYQHATTDSLYAQGRQTSSDFNLKSDIGMLRLLHVYALSDTLTIDPQFLLPFGRIAGGADASALGDASGTGDLILAAPLKLRLNSARDTLSFTPYLYVPTGSYNKDDALNLGENRWKIDLQAAYVKHFPEKWALDLVGDAIWYGDNNDFSANSVRLEQDISYTAQIMGRYMPDTTTSFGIGFGHNWGGETTIDGVAQDNKQKTTDIRLTAAKFVTPKDQVQIQLGRDLSVDNGAKEDFRMNLRYARVF